MNKIKKYNWESAFAPCRARISVYNPPARARECTRVYRRLHAGVARCRTSQTLAERLVETGV